MRAIARRSSRGLSESTQYAVLLPLLLLVTVGIIQAGVWIHGHNVALGAVRAAAEVARGTDANSSAAVGTADRIAAQGGLTQMSVSVDRGQTSVIVRMSAHIPMFFDVGLGDITETATAPVERVTQP